MNDTTRADPIAEARRQWEAHGWEAAAPAMAAVTTIARVNQILTARIEETLAPLGLTFARFEILRLLGFTRRGRLPMGKIGERLQIHPASVTSAVKRLERDGLITRHADEGDARIVHASLRPKGRSVLTQATDLINGVFEDLPVGTQELETAVAILNTVRADAGDVVATPIR